MLGDCWFLASAAALAEIPERIEKIFTNSGYPKEGIFEMTFFHKNMPKKQVIDDRLPVFKRSDNKLILINSRASPN